jgi:hypothetical protein
MSQLEVQLDKVIDLDIKFLHQVPNLDIEKMQLSGASTIYVKKGRRNLLEQ